MTARLSRRTYLALIALLVAACSGPPGGTPLAATEDTNDVDTPVPTLRATPTPEPTPSPSPKPAWTIKVSDVTYTGHTFVGAPITVTAKVKNSGKGDNLGLQFQFSDLSDHADLVGCKPACSTNDFLGLYAGFDGLPEGKSKTYKITFVATAVGAAHWSICVYDEPQFGEQVFCASATTVVS